MDIQQTVTFSLPRMTTALNRILRDLAPEEKTLSTNAFRRLVAYELMASPEITDFNHALKTQSGSLYVEQRKAFDSANPPASTEGCMVLRAPLLEVVDIFIKKKVDVENGSQPGLLAERIVAQHKQRLCCWFSVNKKKACPCDAVDLPTQAKQHAYVFCTKHWSPVMRKEGLRSENDAILPASETDLDEWMKAIV